VLLNPLQVPLLPAVVALLGSAHLCLHLPLDLPVQAPQRLLRQAQPLAQPLLAPCRQHLQAAQAQRLELLLAQAVLHLAGLAANHLKQQAAPLLLLLLQIQECCCWGPAAAQRPLVLLRCLQLLHLQLVEMLRLLLQILKQDLLQHLQLTQDQ
jgi:hypothetical protein